jgi:cyclophilin family peptidyl-prolyl cis-trans isomerase
MMILPTTDTGGSTWDGRPLTAEPSGLGLGRGAVATATAGPGQVVGSQFFILLTDDPRLEQQYVVFGTVAEGLEVADLIASREGDPYPAEIGGFRPRAPVRLERCRIEVEPGLPVDLEQAEPDPPGSDSSPAES